MKLAPFQYQKVLGYLLSRTISAKCSPFSRPMAQKQPPLQDYHWKMPPPLKMVSHTSASTLNTSQRYCSHCNSVSPTTSSIRSRKNRVPHCKSDRQNPLILSSYMHHCQNTNIEAKTTRSPSKTTRSPSKINNHLSQDITTDIPLQQVSHFSTVNPLSSVETSLITDTAIDGNT